MLRTRLTLTLSAATLLACGDDPAEPSPDEPGSIRVVVATAGATPDADGYTLSLDGGPGRAVATDGAVVFDAVAPGTYIVEIRGLQVNCAVDEESLSVAVSAGAAAETRFDVTCPLALFDQIVFTADAGLGTGNDLHRMNPDGSGIERIPSTDGTDSFAAVSRDGTRIVFTALLSGNEDIYVVGADGTGLTRLTTDAAQDREPSWSPDGARIAFVSTRDGNQEVYTMAADGTDVRRLTNAPGFDSQPSWSPAGTRIAFVSDRDGDTEVYTMATDGTDVVALTDDPAVDAQAAWSWDGTAIAFASNRNGTFDLFTMNIDGGNVQPLVADAGLDRSPVWSPDGSSVVFMSDRDGNFELYRVPSSGGAAVRLTTRPEFNQVWLQGWGPLRQ